MNEKQIRLAIINSLNCWGGGEKWAVDIANEFKSLGHHVIIIARKNSPLSKNAQNNNMITYEFNMNSDIQPFDLIRLSKILKNEKINLIAAGEERSMFMGCSIKIFSKQIKHVYMCRGNAIIIRNFKWFLFFIKRANASCICNSHDLYNFYVSTHPAIKPFLEKQIVQNYVDIQQFLSIDTNEAKKGIISELNISKNSLLIGLVGRLDPCKRYKEFIENSSDILKKNKNVHILVVGSGPEKDAIINTVDTLSLNGNVHVLGFRSDIPVIMNALDILAVASIVESMTYVLIEAAVGNTALIGFDVTGVNETIINNKTGYLIPQDNWPLFMSNMKKLIDNKKVRNEFSRNAYQHVANNFSKEIIFTLFKNMLLEKL
jgi:glycosyltransferase involved in cell wall biosynthesis